MGAENRPGLFGVVKKFFTSNREVGPVKALEELRKPSVGNLHYLMVLTQNETIKRLGGRQVSKNFLPDLKSPDHKDKLETGGIELLYLLPTSKGRGDFRVAIIHTQTTGDRQVVNFFLSNESQKDKSLPRKMRISIGSIGKDGKVIEGPSFKVNGNPDSLIELTPTDSSQDQGINAEETTNIARQAYGFIVAGYEEKRKQK